MTTLEKEFSKSPPRSLLLIVVLFLTLFSMIGTGIIGLGRDGQEQGVDGSVLYAAGRTWLAHGNPYDHNQLSHSVEGVLDMAGLVFFYPPQASGICVPLGLFPYSLSRYLWLTINLLCVLGIAGMTTWSLRFRGIQGLRSWIAVVLVLGNPFTSHVLWMGQTSLLAVAAIMASFVTAYAGELNSVSKNYGREITAGIFLGLASFKPQLCLLVGLWFLLERRWFLLAAAATTGLLLSVYAMLAQGPLGMLQAWHEALTNYSALIYNAPNAPYKVGFDTLLSSAGMNVPESAITVVGVMGTIVAWIYRKRWEHADCLAILMALTFLFVGHSHDYDYVGIIPVMLSLCYFALLKPKRWLAVAPLLIVLFFPHRIIRDFNCLVLDQWRTIILLVMMIFVLCWSCCQRKKALQSSFVGETPFVS